jgi:hypothetical protein
MKKEMANNVPLGRLGDSDEIAKAVSWRPPRRAKFPVRNCSSMEGWPKSEPERCAIPVVQVRRLTI